MAVTHAITLATADDGTRMVLASITMDSSYAAGGEVVTPNLVGLTRITGALVGNAMNATPVGFVGVWDQANLKLAVFGQDDASVGGLIQQSGDLSALVFTVLFFGV